MSLNSFKAYELSMKVWSITDRLRGRIDSAYYRKYIITMFFYKYISDRWTEALERNKEKYKDSLVGLSSAMYRERFVIPGPLTFDYLLKYRTSPDIGSIINEVLNKIADVNSTLYGMFRNVNFDDERILGEGHEKILLLDTMISMFEDIDLRHSRCNDEVVADSFEILIDRFAASEGKKGGEYFTPGSICRLLAGLTAPQRDDEVYDPACGSGGILIHQANFLKEKYPALEYNGIRLSGQEINADTWEIARINMLLHNIDNSEIEWGDAINQPKFLDRQDLLRKFDIVVSNPPFAVSNWWNKEGGDLFGRFDWGMPPKNKGDYAFILHMLASVKETGRVGIVSSQGVLFRGGSEAAIRRKVIEHNLLEAVIGLPPNLLSNTSIPCVILFFNKARKRNTNVLFIDASRDYEPGKRQNVFTEKNIGRVLATYEAYKADSSLKSKAIEPGFSHIATVEEIGANDFNFSIARYINHVTDDVDVDVRKLKTEIALLDKRVEEIQEKLDQRFRNLGI